MIKRELKLKRRVIPLEWEEETYDDSKRGETHSYYFELIR